MADCSGYTDEQLACELRQAEDLFSTCAYPGDRYYLAIIYQVLAVQELRQLYSAYASAQMAAIANGGSFKPCEIELCHTAHGQLLKGLDKRNAIGRVFVT
jgi:hypothetical protein